MAGLNTLHNTHLYYRLSIMAKAVLESRKMNALLAPHDSQSPRSPKCRGIRVMPNEEPGEVAVFSQVTPTCNTNT